MKRVKILILYVAFFKENIDATAQEFFAAGEREEWDGVNEFCMFGAGLIFSNLARVKVPW